LVQAFLKKWWVESDCKAPNLPLSLRLKGSGEPIKVVLLRIYFIEVSVVSHETVIHMCVRL
jgi:hypothetical protein